MRQTEYEELREKLSEKLVLLRSGCTKDEVTSNRTVNECINILDEYYEAHKE